MQTLWVDFVSGGLASMCAITLVHPIDVVKSRKQFVGEPVAKSSQTGSISPKIDVFSTKTANSIEILPRIDPKSTPLDVQSIRGDFSSKSRANWLETDAKSSKFEPKLMKIDVFSSKINGSSSKINANTSVFSYLRLIYEKEGPRALFRGLPAAYALQFTVTATRFGVYGFAKQFWKNVSFFAS